MLKKVLIVVSLFLGITIGTLSTGILLNYNVFPTMNETTLRLVVTIGTTVVFVLMSLLFSDKFVTTMKRIEDRLSKTPIQKIVFTTIGLILGLLVAALLSAAVDVIAGAGIMGRIISSVIYVVFGYLGLILGYRRGGEFISIFDAFRFNNRNKDKEAKQKSKKLQEVMAKVIDTSALIDSRIHDVAKTGFFISSFSLSLYRKNFIVNRIIIIKDNKLKIVCNVELYIWNILPRATEPSARPAIGVGKFLIIFIDNSLYHYSLLLYNIKFESAIII